MSNRSVFCAFLIVANLCPAPSPFTLSIPAGAIDSSIREARHHFDASYNASIAWLGDGHARTLADVVPGYGTSVLRVGCQGWREACDGSGRVC